MNMLSQYEVAWNMFQAGSKVDQISLVVNKHRSTVYRWIKQIQLKGMEQFLQYKKD